MTVEHEFLGPNIAYLLELYDRYRQDPNSLDEATRQFFAGWQPPALSGVPLPVDYAKVIQAAELAQEIRSRGYLSADLDPLENAPAPDLQAALEAHSLQEDDLRSLPAAIAGLPAGRARRGARHRPVGDELGAQADPEHDGE